MDKMREEFEQWNDAPGRFGPAHKYRSGHDYSLPHIQRAWTAWQHLYPMVEAAYREAVFDHHLPITWADKGWNNSTAKARLEGKDE